MEQEAMDLYTLQMMLREGVSSMFPESLWVTAEIGQISAHRGGHCYLELCQNDGREIIAKCKATIWRSKAALLLPYFEAAAGTPLSAGMQILARVQVSYSELYGMNLSIDRIDPAYTAGQKELEKKETIRRLTEEGLMDMQKGLALPALPRYLALVSAEGAAGYGDFMRHISESGYAIRTELFQASMQGADCASSIAGALSEVAASDKPFDAVLILRGGGSEMDLACFDEYELAAAIALCPLPVVTAIGHDRDFHVADMVACDYVKTPTALADLFISFFDGEMLKINALEQRMAAAAQAFVSRMEHSLELLEMRIKGADPRLILSRGYTLATDASGRVLKSAAGVAAGDRMRVMFADGTLECEVKKKL